jgi:hypothetical protein
VTFTQVLDEQNIGDVQSAFVVHPVLQPLLLHPMAQVCGAGPTQDPAIQVPCPVNIPPEQVGPAPQFPVG